MQEEEEDKESQEVGEALVLAGRVLLAAQARRNLLPHTVLEVVKRPPFPRVNYLQDVVEAHDPRFLSIGLLSFVNIFIHCLFFIFRQYGGLVDLSSKGKKNAMPQDQTMGQRFDLRLHVPDGDGSRLSREAFPSLMDRERDLESIHLVDKPDAADFELSKETAVSPDKVEDAARTPTSTMQAIEELLLLRAQELRENGIQGNFHSSPQYGAGYFAQPYSNSDPAHISTLAPEYKMPWMFVTHHHYHYNAPNVPPPSVINNINTGNIDNNNISNHSRSSEPGDGEGEPCFLNRW